jgi:hypothetical protein
MSKVKTSEGQAKIKIKSDLIKTKSDLVKSCLIIRWRGTELEFVIMVIAVSCVKLLSAHNSTQHTSRKHKV